MKTAYKKSNNTKGQYRIIEAVVRDCEQRVVMCVTVYRCVTRLAIIPRVIITDLTRAIKSTSPGHSAILDVHKTS